MELEDASLKRIILKFKARYLVVGCYSSSALRGPYCKRTQARRHTDRSAFTFSEDAFLGLPALVMLF